LTVMKKKIIEYIGGSFRDPSGFLFLYNNKLYRQINKRYKEHYKFCIESGLYGYLTKKNYLIPHIEVASHTGLGLPWPEKCYRIIQPEMIPFVSYPYEWCFSQLKNAALLTLKIQKIALQKGMTLKDASAYNIQFFGTEPILIDSLSFEIYRPGTPWIAYRQFCQHFLAPLALSCYRDIRLNQFSRIYIDG